MPRVLSAVMAQARRGEHNLGPTHFRMLKILSQRSSTPSGLAKAMGVSLPSMSASVQTLVARGWVERRRSQSDRRITQLQVSPLGRQVLQEEYGRVTGWTAALLERMNADELRKVEEGLQALLHLFQDASLPPGDEPVAEGQKPKTRQTSR